MIKTEKNKDFGLIFDNFEILVVVGGGRPGGAATEVSPVNGRRRKLAWV
jgi:hypothetical protein